ncbi:MAG: hypothetical protein PHQ33_03175 [Bacteroidales bacterium]|nr:hypothetical protein [Bacteroidales bacterium]
MAKKGLDGASAQIQYSADGITWHTPYTSVDLYMRQRVGNGTWSDAIRIAPEQIAGDINIVIKSPSSDSITIYLHDYIGGNYEVLCSKCEFVSGSVTSDASAESYATEGGVEGNIYKVTAGSKVSVTISLKKTTAGTYDDAGITFKRLSEYSGRTYIFVKEETEA